LGSKKTNILPFPQKIGSDRVQSWSKYAEVKMGGKLPLNSGEHEKRVETTT